MTGRIYESREAAIAAGIPVDALAQVPRHAVHVQRECYKTRDMGRSKYQPHQGARELARRARRKVAA